MTATVRDTAPAFVTTHATDALVALTSGPALSYGEFLTAAPAGQGLYGVVVDEEGAGALGLDGRVRAGGLVYVGAARRSLRDRGVRAHFQSGRTAASTLRRSIVALVGVELGLSAEPRSPGVADTRLTLTSDAEGHLTAWMQEHLGLRAWEAPSGRGAEVVDVEREVVRELRPALNLRGVDEPWQHLREQRHAATRRSLQSATL